MSQIKQHFIAAHIGQTKIQYHDLIFVKVCQFQRVLAAIGFIYVHTLIFKGLAQALSQQDIIINQQNTHLILLSFTFPTSTQERKKPLTDKSTFREGL